MACINYNNDVDAYLNMTEIRTSNVPYDVKVCTAISIFNGVDVIELECRIT